VPKQAAGLPKADKESCRAGTTLHPGLWRFRGR